MMVYAQKIIFILIVFALCGCYTQVRAPEPVGQTAYSPPPVTHQEPLPTMAPVRPYPFYGQDLFYGQNLFHDELCDPYDFRSGYYRDQWGYLRYSTTRFVPHPEWLWDYGYWHTRYDPWRFQAVRTVWVPVYVGTNWQSQDIPVAVERPARPQIRREHLQGAPVSASDVRQAPPVSTPTVVNHPPAQTPQATSDSSGSSKQAQEEKKEETKEEKREEKRSGQRRRGGMQ